MSNLLNRINQKMHRDCLSVNKKILQLKIKLTKNTRPHSYPYITCDGFRHIADHIFDNVDNKTIAPLSKNKDIIFVDGVFTEKFFKYIHPQITEPYILITHNGIKPINKKLAENIDDKIIHWFGKNVLTEHNKITPLPIGLGSLYMYGNGIIKIRKSNIVKTNKKINKILFHFKIATNPKERTLAHDYIKKHPIAETFTYKLTPSLYAKKLAGYKFVLSPPGAGEECHRTWEALYHKTIPIAKKCTAINYFSKIGAPIWVVDDWSDLDNINEKLLVTKYKNLMSQEKEETLYLNFWIKKISKYSNKTAAELIKKYEQ